MTIQEITQTKENFHDYFEKWVKVQKQHLEELNEALSYLLTSTAETSLSNLGALIKRVVDHYEEYYKVKSRCAKEDVLLMLSPTWTTSLEDAFLWIGGWRPTMAIHLLYSKSGLQLEVRLTELTRDLPAMDLADLGPSQLIRVDQLQSKIVKEEREIGEKMAKHQSKVADPDMVGLAHELFEDEVRVDAALKDKEDGLEKILKRADDLRLRTLKGVVDILSPSQALHFLIAAAELHLRLHYWGEKREEKEHVKDV